MRSALSWEFVAVAGREVLMGRRGREGEAGALLVLLRLAFVRPWDERLESQMAVIEPEGVGRGRTEERTKARVHGGKERGGGVRMGTRGRGRWSICGCKARPRKS